MKRIICIVETTRQFEILRLVLELRGYDVQEFEDGVTFLERGNFEDILCFIFDLNLPGEFGVQGVGAAAFARQQYAGLHRDRTGEFPHPERS